MYAFFIEFGFDILNRNGIITYIVPHTWKATDSFSKLREIMFTQHSVKQIVNLDMGIFDAIVQPLIMLATYNFDEHSDINIFNSNFSLTSGVDGYRTVLTMKGVGCHKIEVKAFNAKVGFKSQNVDFRETELLELNFSLIDNNKPYVLLIIVDDKFGKEIVGVNPLV